MKYLDLFILLCGYEVYTYHTKLNDNLKKNYIEEVYLTLNLVILIIVTNCLHLRRTLRI